MRSIVPEFILRKAREKKSHGSINASVLRVSLNDSYDILPSAQTRSFFEDRVIRETMRVILNPAIEAMQESGGFITGFDGETITGIFPGKNCNCAINAAVKIRDLLQRVAIKHPESGKLGVTSFYGLAYGPVRWQIMTGQEQAIYWFSGPAIKNATEAQNLSMPNQILLDQSILSTLDKKMIKTKRIDNRFRVLKYSDLPIVAHKITQSRLSQKAFIPQHILDKDLVSDFQEVFCCQIELKKPLEKQIQALRTLSAQYDGCINKIDYSDRGWSSLIVLGIPVTEDDIALRGLDLITELHTICQNNMRAGLTYGKVYSGFIGTENCSAYAILGMPVNIASQCMLQAKWGEIRCDKNILKKHRDHLEFEPLGPLMVDGYSKYTDTFLLLLKGDGLKKTHFQTNFIGRASELDQLEKSCQSLWQNRFAGTTYIIGEAGQGKTRLVNEFKQKLGAKAEFFILNTFSNQQVALNPFVDWVRESFTGNQTGSVSVRRKDFREQWSKFRQKINELSSSPRILKEVDRIESIIAGIIGLEWKGSIYTRLEPNQKLSVKNFALKTLLELFCLLKPVIMAIEDLQWLDQESIEIIRLLTGKGTRIPCKFIITSRMLENGEYPDLPVDDINEAEQIYLKGLDLVQVGMLMKSLLQKEVSADITEHIYTVSNGNPFIVEEITRYFHDADKLILLGDRYYQKDASLDLPNEVKSFIEARINRLNPHLKKTILIASLLGTEFPVELLGKLVTVMAKRGNDLNESVIKEHIRMGEKEQIWHIVSENKYVFNHSLLRDVIYQMLGKKEQQKLHQKAAQFLLELYPGDQSILDKVAEHYEKAQEWGKAVLYYTKAGDYEKEQYIIDTSLQNYNKALRLCKKAGNLDGIDESEILNSIGSVYYLKDSYDEALTNYRQALDICIKTLGSHHPNTATTHNNIGRVFLSKREFAEALQCFELAYAIHREVDGAKNPETADSLYNIGTVYSQKEDLDKALAYFNEALSIDEEIPGEHFLRIGNNLNAIGAIYAEKGDFDKALEYYQQAKNSNEQVLRKRHPRIALNLYNMGIVLFYKGKYRIAIEHFEQALSIWREVLGERNSNTVDCFICIATVLSKISEFKNALSYLEKALSINREMMGEEHPDTVYIFDRISAVHILNGDYNNALTYSQQALAIARKYYGDRHINTATNLANMGVIYANKGEYKKSLDCLNEALSIYKEVCGEKHQRTASCISVLGEVCLEQGDFEQALNYHTQVISLRKEILGDRHPETANSLKNLGNTLLQKGEYDKSLSYLEESLDIFQEVLGAKHIKTAVNLRITGTVYLHKEQLDKSLEYLEQSLSILNEITGSQHPEKANCLFELGEAYYRQKNYDKALEFFTQALSIRTNILGKNHPDTVKAKASLARTYTKKRIKKKIGRITPQSA